ncbi:MAG TPA: transporter substrate-binding domain-containing protein, partial [Chthoniobacterales bacterium]|nr:transporter substrate-binding domain-containing protein [Chthoniobacterales bacterium]
GMKKRRLVRMLVVYSKTFYFLDKARQRGATYEAGLELEKELNPTHKSWTRPIRVVFIPTRRDQLLPALAEGRGDIAAGNLTITPGRQQTVDFTTPIARNIEEILVTSRDAPAAKSIEELSGTSLFVRRSSSYFASLQALNSRLAAQRKAPVKVVLADENLEDEDILEMVNAGLVTATIVDSHLAEFWRQIFTNITLHSDVVVRSAGAISWAIRKNSPKLKGALDAFIVKHGIGKPTGNTLLRRYLQNTSWARDATAASDMQRFGDLAKYFRKYAEQYQFDWLLLIAMGYQESGLNQAVRSRAGAIGVMQMMPRTARSPSVNIRNIHLTEPNIHAGVKYLRVLVNEYFDDPGIDPLNRQLFAFAAYNAGPTRMQQLRREAAARGLDANKWFDNVEVVAAERIGRETVQFVSNVFKYYIAYKLSVERTEEREAAKKKPV